MSNGRLTLFNMQHSSQRLFLFCLFLLMAVIQPVRAEKIDIDALIKKTVQAVRADHFEKAYQMIKPLMNSNNERIQSLIAFFYQYGNKEITGEDDHNPYYDLDKSVSYFRKAAKSGNAAVLFAFGMTLRKTAYKYRVLDPNRDKINKEVFDIFLASAEGGHAWSQIQVADEYINAFVVERNYIQAYKWNLLAGRRFDTTTGEGSFKGFMDQTLKRLEKHNLNEMEVLYARALAELWEKKHPNAIKTYPPPMLGIY